jgi:ABC-type nitrate/sulfonate/bicarbonate transport system permease component
VPLVELVPGRLFEGKILEKGSAASARRCSQNRQGCARAPDCKGVRSAIANGETRDETVADSTAEIAAAPRARTSWMDVFKRPRFYRSIISLVVFLVGWELLGRYVLTNKLFFVPISDVAVVFWKLVQNGQLGVDAAASFTAIAYGMALAVIFGVAFGVVLGASRTVADYSEVYLNALYSTPLVAVAPLLILWLGIGLASKVAVVFLISVFPIVISTAAGIRNVDRNFLDVARAFGATKFQIVSKVLVPAALPFVITGIRLAIGRAIVGVVVGELFGATAGLGFLIATAGQTFDVPDLFVGVLCLAFAGVSLTWMVQAIENRLVRGRPQGLES